MKFREVTGELEYKKTKLQLAFEEFLDSGMSKAEAIFDPDEYRDKHTMYSSLYNGARKWARDKIEVLMHDGRVYLLRIDR